MVKRAETVISLVKSIIRQEAEAKIIIGGDLNGQMAKVHIQMVGAGFTPALREVTATHREGNRLDQLWSRNITITNAVVAKPVDQVSDHSPIVVTMEATTIQR